MKWRKCQVFKNGEWLDSDLGMVQKGDTFRLFEENRMPVRDNLGREQFVALDDAVSCDPEGNFSVKVAQ